MFALSPFLVEIPLF